MTTETEPRHSGAERTILARPRWVFGWATAVLVTILAVFYFANRYWPYRYRIVEPTLEQVFASRIKMEHYHRIYFPHPGFVADGLTLSRESALDLPPVGSVDHVRVEGRWVDLVLLRRRIRLVEADRLHVVIPPVGSAANKKDFPPGSSGDFTGPSTVVERLDLRDALLDILRTDGGRYSFPIRSLVLENLQKNTAMKYTVEMQNARPTGIINAHGSFGPLVQQQLGNTPVSGEFTFDSARLEEVGGIAGVLSAKGRFHGNLAGIEASADAAIPDFAVGHGRRSPMSGTVSGAVNALNGNVLLHGVEVRLGKTTMHAQGTIAGAPKVTELELSVREGRAEDLLQPFLAGQPPITGPVQLHSHATLAGARAGATFFQRLTMKGAFDIPAERITDPGSERSLTAFSHRAQGAGTSVEDVDPHGPQVFSRLAGLVVVRNGVAHATRLTFGVPGAEVNVQGEFDLRSQNVHMTGDVRMDSDISHVTTGWKSILLKPLAPFFKKKGAGAVVPIAVTGAPGSYKVGQNVIPK